MEIDQITKTIKKDLMKNSKGELAERLAFAYQSLEKAEKALAEAKLEGVRGLVEWVKPEEQTDTFLYNYVFLGQSPDWIDEDYNPDGLRECFYSGDSWISAHWNNYQDYYETDGETTPKLICIRPTPPKAIEGATKKFILSSDHEKALAEAKLEGVREFLTKTRDHCRDETICDGCPMLHIDCNNMSKVTDEDIKKVEGI